MANECNLPDAEMEGVRIHQEDEDTYYVFDKDSEEFLSALDFEHIPERAVVEILHSRFGVMYTNAVIAGNQMDADKIQRWLSNLDELRKVMSEGNAKGS